ncbi:hypothetical protein FIV42_01025 [Persicimonas caeni]|uniref:Uncharacterized protein n=1 Tax=Persicimonas caeni TaxID=2292766 RepID=A0A4Y6PNH7_PERCE|nr:archaemetzincin [Persicimonas caeni]QDG49365.1 hypothetical protein FIV42_01025 [Persicimonas caeni]QED30586.1 hypothetical protein FRD00_01020 [Persicimonas caeni]
MDDTSDFLPWWVRHQRLVLAASAVVLVAAVSAWFVAETQLAAGVERCDPEAEAELGSDDWASGVVDVAAFTPLDEPGGGDWRAIHKEPRQCFSDWLDRKRQDVTQERRTLYLQPIGSFDAEASPDMETLAEFGRIYFGLPVKVMEPLDPASLELSKRQLGGEEQWLTTDVLDELETRLPNDAYAMLGLTMTDLWPGDGWNFVFGQARLSGRVGIYSFARYDPGPGVRPADDRRRMILLRSMKVMSHETGHMFGITHCLHYECNMNGSNSLYETDSQPIHLCPVDLRKLHHAVSFDIHRRYLALAEFYAEQGLVEQAEFVRLRASTNQPKTD